ncbi:kinetochore scaffold 1, partial [Clarias magur]
MSKRRLSSILKAPRPSVTVLGNDQDENQDETRSIDKRRSSRRVSFAAKNNVHVFPKDVKADPVLAHIQNLTVGASDGLSENMQCFDSREKPEIMGLDTMLTTSMHAALNKENFFPEPVLPDSLDRTMLFGEGTGCVDITQSHTIAIDLEEPFNPECTLNRLSEPPKLVSQNSMPSKTPGSMGKDQMLSEFNDFLASLSKTSAQNATASFPQKNSDVFPLENTRNAEIDKENVLPVYGQNRTERFQRTISATPVTDCDDMEMTQSQTVVLETKYGEEPISKSSRSSSLASFNTGSADKIMNTTQTGNITPGALSSSKRNVTLVTHNQSDFMDLTYQGLTEVLPSNVDSSVLKGGRSMIIDSKPIPTTSVMMSKPQASFMPLPSVNTGVKRPHQISVSHIVDMEMTECHTVGFNLEKTEGDMEMTECHTVGFNLEKTEGDMEMTECHTVGFNLEKTEGDMEMTECHTVGFNLEKTRHTEGDMEMTECHTVGFNLEKTEADMEMTECHSVGYDLEKTHHTVGAMEMTECQSVGDDMEMTECQTMGYNLEKTCNAVGDDMEMTKCQTVVLDPKVYHDYKPNKRLSHVSTPFGANDVAHEHIVPVELNRYSCSKRTKTESCEVSTTPMFLLQDLPDMQDGGTSDKPGINDDLELTECKTITIDTKIPCVESPANQAQDAPGASSRSPIDKLKRSEGILASQSVNCKSFVSVLDLVENHEEKQNVSGSAVTGIDSTKNQRVDTKIDNKNYNSLHTHLSFHSLFKNAESSEDCNMEMTRAFTVPLVEQPSVAINQGMAREVVETAPVTTDQMLMMDEDQPVATTSKAVSSAKKGAHESDTATLGKEHLSSGKPRRMSLADLQVKLQHMSQYMNEPDRQLAGSITAPLVSFTEVSPVKQHPERQSSSEASKEMQLLENKINLSHKEGCTPFSLKNSLLARLSVGGGVTPKFPSRGRSVSPTQTEPQSPTGVQGLHLQTGFSTDVLNDGYETDLVNEVLPEEDFSGTLVSYRSENNEPELTTGDGLNEDAVEFNHTESVGNQNLSENMPPEAQDTAVKDPSNTLWESNCASQNTHVVKVMDDTNSSSSYTTRCEGMSELNLRDSQLDSQIEGSVEFDIHKKLEDGSVTINEFLAHFGAKFVIHRSRPSARPDNFMDPETCTPEDLLRNKYIHRPKQSVYERDCQKLSQMVEELRSQIGDQEKPLREINEALLQDVRGFSHEQFQRFGSKLKERKLYFSKTSKARSHEMKEHLYSELLQTTREAKESLTSKIKETDEMLEELDGCITDLESDLLKMSNMDMGDPHSLMGLEPTLKAKQEQLVALNSELTEKEKQISTCKLQVQSLEDTCDKLRFETRELECRAAHLDSLNEWRLKVGEKKRLVFMFLHDTLQLEVKHRDSEQHCEHGDADQAVDMSFTFLLNAERSRPTAVLVHRLLEENISSQLSTWIEKYSTTRHIPMLLHEVSVVVSRLRLLGDEIHLLKKWGGLKLEILKLACVDTAGVVMSSAGDRRSSSRTPRAPDPDPSQPCEDVKTETSDGGTFTWSEVHVKKEETLELNIYSHGDELDTTPDVICIKEEDPDNEDYLYCEVCKSSFFNKCEVHGSPLFIPDTPVPMGVPDRALQTLPPGLEIQESGIPNAGLGVFNKGETVPVGAHFGPYQGELVDREEAMNSGYSWV